MSAVAVDEAQRRELRGREVKRVEERRMCG